MKHLKFILIIILFYRPANCKCADIIIKYIVEKDSLNHSKHSVSDYNLGIVSNNWDSIDLDSRKEIPSVKTIILNTSTLEIVIIKYQIGHDGTYFIKDGFGHEIFLDQSMDKDTVVLSLKRGKFYKKDADGRNLLHLNDSVVSMKFYTIQYPKKYKYMGFFDSIAYVHGDLKAGGGGYSFKELNNNLETYLAKVNHVYADRLRFYKSYIRDYSMPSKLKYYALKEIQYAYYNDLIDPLNEVDANLLKDYPKSLQDSVRSISNNLNNDELYNNTSSYRTVSLYYLSLGIEVGSLKSLRDNFDYDYVSKQKDYIKKNLKGKFQGYTLAWYMLAASQKDDKKSFELLYQNYDSENSAPGIDRLVDTLHSTVIGTGSLSPDEVLNLKFEDIEHKAHNLSELFNENIILIDCWATWCIPCREQMPALNELAGKFKGKVQFISLSADQFLTKWDSWMIKAEKNANILQLHAPGGFENTFFRRLYINAIPRYILISKSGKILNVAMPYPSDKNEFEKQLKKYL